MRYTIINNGDETMNTALDMLEAIRTAATRYPKTPQQAAALLQDIIDAAEMAKRSLAVTK
jgi:hypothetical protein